MYNKQKLQNFPLESIYTYIHNQPFHVLYSWRNRNTIASTKPPNFSIHTCRVIPSFFKNSVPFTRQSKRTVSNSAQFTHRTCRIVKQTQAARNLDQSPIREKLACYIPFFFKGELHDFCVRKKKKNITVDSHVWFAQTLSTEWCQT
jgi:hypothetical protein